MGHEGHIVKSERQEGTKRRDEEANCFLQNNIIQ